MTAAPGHVGGRWLPVVAVAVGALFAAPLVYLVVRVVDVGVSGRVLGGPLTRTLVLAATVTAAAAIVGTAQAWILWRTDLPGRRWLRVLAPLPLVIPSFVGASALLAAFARGGVVDELLGVDTLPDVHGFVGAWIVLTVLTTPYVLLPVAARLRELPPSLEETARLLGRGGASTFATVVLPQIAPAVSAGSLLVLLYVLSDFGAVALLRYDTLTRAIYSARLFDQATSLTLSLTLAGLALVCVIGQRVTVARMPQVSAARTRSPLVAGLGRWTPLAAVVAVLPTLVGLVAPIGVLGWWAVRGDGLGERLSDLGLPALHTGGIALVTAALAAVAVLPVAYVQARRGGRAASASTALVLAGFALPGLVVALALVFWALELPEAIGLYQTLPLLVVAYLVHFGAQALGATTVAFQAAPVRLTEAAALLGAGPRRRFLSIELPLLLPGLLAGAGLVLLSTMKELPATLLLAPIGFDTLATRIWGASEDGFLGEVGAASIVLVAVSLVLMQVVGRPEVRE